jgi:hypothetical protein
MRPSSSGIVGPHRFGRIGGEVVGHSLHHPEEG